jgi:16S rRNA G1207 methylase RsmC
VAALAAVGCADGVNMHAADSNARAVERVLRSAELNGLSNPTIERNTDGDYAEVGDYDLALANSPYDSGDHIAQYCLAAGQAALRSGGTMRLCD